VWSTPSLTALEISPSPPAKADESANGHLSPTRPPLSNTGRVELTWRGYELGGLETHRQRFEPAQDGGLPPGRRVSCQSQARQAAEERVDGDLGLKPR
jgi:hypothetical protein